MPCPRSRGQTLDLIPHRPPTWLTGYWEDYRSAGYAGTFPFKLAADHFSRLEKIQSKDIDDVDVRAHVRETIIRPQWREYLSKAKFRGFGIDIALFCFQFRTPSPTPPAPQRPDRQDRPSDREMTAADWQAGSEALATEAARRGAAGGLDAALWVAYLEQHAEFYAENARRLRAGERALPFRARMSDLLARLRAPDLTAE